MNSENMQLKIAAVILAGGRSSRMGTPKAGLSLATGRTIFEHVYECVKDLSLPCVVAGHAEGIQLCRYPDLTVIPDEISDRGPVGALLGVLNSNIAHHYMVIGCDQPLMRPILLRKLLTEIDERPCAFRNQADGNLSPLPGLYPAALLPIVEILLQQPRASLRELLAKSDVRMITLDQANWEYLRSANTPQDVAYVNTVFLQHPNSTRK